MKSNFILIIISIIILKISTIQCNKFSRQISTKFEQNFKRDVTESSSPFDSRMLFGVTCVSNDTVYCNKIIKSFNTVGEILSSVILFKEALVVNVTVEQNCILGSFDCTVDEANFIGTSSPGSMVLLMDDFGIERYYQQPLAKQFFSDLPEYDDIDIYARFALRSDYWFPGDPLSTTQNLDFTYIVLREMIHSLGFYSSWRMRFREDNTIIVPRPYCNDGTGDCDIYGRNKDKVWIGFREHIFDKYLMNLYTGEMLTNKTSYLNKLFDSNIIHGRISKLEKGLQGSSQYEIAKEMYGLATTNGTIGFLSWSDMQFSDSLVLETNIVPFDNDINLKYIDNIYTNTSDFLMRNQWPIGITLQDQIIAGGNYSNGTLYGSIGPKLRRMFETIGYATVDNPIVTQSPKIPLPLPPINAMSIGNSLTFNTLYQTYLFLIIVAYEIYF